MATLEQIGAALRKADAAGNTEDARRLAQAYKAMRQQQEPSAEAPPSGAVDMSVSDRFAARRAEQPEPSLADKLMNATAATVNGLTASVPGLQQTSDALMGAGGMLLGKDYGETVRGLQDRRAQIAEAAPISRASGEIGGTIASLGTLGATRLGAEALGMTGGLGKQLLNSSASTAGLSGLGAIAEGKDGAETLTDMGIGALAGPTGTLAVKGLTKAGEGIARGLTGQAQKRATTETIKDAPQLTDLKSQAADLFKSSKGSGVGVKGEVFGNFARDLSRKAKEADIDPDLDGEAYRAFERLISFAREGIETGQGVSLSRLHNLRQIANDVVIEAKKDRTKTFGRQIVEGLDDLVGKLKPQDMAIPGGRLGDSASAGNDLLQGISTWARAKKLGLIDEAITAAQYQKSGVENGLRLNFLKLIRNPKTRKLFSAAEIQAIEAVGNGNIVSNLARLGGLFGFNLGSGSANVFGGSAGLLMGGIPAAVLAAGARKGSEAMTSRAAQRAAKVVATPNIPTVAPRANPLLPYQKPLEIVVRGGTLAGPN